MSDRSLGLGRLVAPDDKRDALFRLRARIAEVKRALEPTPRKREYHEGPLLFQSSTPRCVAFSGAGFVFGAPIMPTFDDPAIAALIDGDGMFGKLYALCQDLDEWPGNNYDGTSVRGLMKALQQLGIIGSYLWGQTPEEDRDWIMGGYGTLIDGTNWYLSMDEVDSKGFIVEPAAFATPIGGHAYRRVWWDKKKQGWKIRNSWGQYWGIPLPKHKVEGGPGLSGEAYMSDTLLRRLRREDGEAAAPSQVRLSKRKAA